MLYSIKVRISIETNRNVLRLYNFFYSCNIRDLEFNSYYILGVVDHDETEALKFVTQMKAQYPTALSSFHHDFSELDNLHAKILSARIDFNSTFSSRAVADGNVALTTASVLSTLLTKDITTTGFQNLGRVKRAATPNNDVHNTGSKINEHVDDYPLEVDLAHYFHYCSITILAILVVEVIIQWHIHSFLIF
jgi:hypothetical protein